MNSSRLRFMKPGESREAVALMMVNAVYAGAATLPYYRKKDCNEGI